MDKFLVKYMNPLNRQDGQRVIEAVDAYTAQREFVRKYGPNIPIHSVEKVET